MNASVAARRHRRLNRRIARSSNVNVRKTPPKISRWPIAFQLIPTSSPVVRRSGSKPPPIHTGVNAAYRTTINSEVPNAAVHRRLSIDSISTASGGRRR